MFVWPSTQFSIAFHPRAVHVVDHGYMTQICNRAYVKLKTHINLFFLNKQTNPLIRWKNRVKHEQ